MKASSLAEVLTVAEASREKGVSENGIRIAIRDGRLPEERRGLVYLIRRRDLEEWQPIGHRPKKAEKHTREPADAGERSGRMRAPRRMPHEPTS